MNDIQIRVKQMKHYFTLAHTQDCNEQACKLSARGEFTSISRRIRAILSDYIETSNNINELCQKYGIDPCIFHNTTLDYFK